MDQVSRHHGHLDHPYHQNCSFLPKSALDNDMLNAMNQAYATVSNELDHVKCFFMSGIFSSRFARRWAKVPSIYRYFLRFRSASIKATLSQRQHRRTREHLETVSMDPQPLHQALPDRLQRFPGDDKQ